jgi:hypothetical protein
MGTGETMEMRCMSLCTLYLRQSVLKTFSLDQSIQRRKESNYEAIGK